VIVQLIVQRNVDANAETVRMVRQILVKNPS
jgi:hypothetical protein